MTLCDRMEALKRDIDSEEGNLMDAQLRQDRQRADAASLELEILYRQKDRLARIYSHRVLAPF